MRLLAYEGFFIARPVSVSVKPQKDSRKVSPPTTHAADEGEPISLSLAWPTRLGLSIALIAHLLAIASEPFLMFSRSAMKTGTDATLLRRGLGPYVEMLYLDHGYFFFAPNPGPSHILECRLFDEGKDTEGEPKQRLRFPDRRVHWPRLYYHRHFMLSEFYQNSHTWTDQPLEAKLDPKIDAEWRQELSRYQQLQRSVIKHLQSVHPQQSIVLKRIEHQLPNDYRVLVERWRLHDPRLYEVMPESLAERDGPTSNPPVSTEAPIHLRAPSNPPLPIDRSNEAVQPTPSLGQSPASETISPSPLQPRP